jgi:hypothetical protein
MNTMQGKRRPEDAEHDPPPEVMDRLAELLPEGALDAAVKGLKPEELSAGAGCCPSSPAASWRPRWRPR